MSVWKLRARLAWFSAIEFELSISKRMSTFSIALFTMGICTPDESLGTGTDTQRSRHPAFDIAIMHSTPTTITFASRRIGASLTDEGEHARCPRTKHLFHKALQSASPANEATRVGASRVVAAVLRASRVCVR